MGTFLGNVQLYMLELIVHHYGNQRNFSKMGIMKCNMNGQFLPFFFGRDIAFEAKSFSVMMNEFFAIMLIPLFEMAPPIEKYAW